VQSIGTTHPAVRGASRQLPRLRTRQPGEPMWSQHQKAGTRPSMFPTDSTTPSASAAAHGGVRPRMGLHPSRSLGLPPTPWHRRQARRELRSGHGPTGGGVRPGHPVAAYAAAGQQAQVPSWMSCSRHHAYQRGIFSPDQCSGRGQAKGRGMLRGVIQVLQRASGECLLRAHPPTPCARLVTLSAW
jgi:hypothetical protein